MQHTSHPLRRSAVQLRTRIWLATTQPMFALQPTWGLWRHRGDDDATRVSPTGTQRSRILPLESADGVSGSNRSRVPSRWNCGLRQHSPRLRLRGHLFRKMPASSRSAPHHPDVGKTGCCLQDLLNTPESILQRVQWAVAGGKERRRRARAAGTAVKSQTPNRKSSR